MKCAALIHALHGDELRLYLCCLSSARLFAEETNPPLGKIYSRVNEYLFIKILAEETNTPFVKIYP